MSKAAVLTTRLRRERPGTIRESLEGGRKGTRHTVLLASPLASGQGLQGWEQQGPSCQWGCK